MNTAQLYVKCTAERISVVNYMLCYIYIMIVNVFKFNIPQTIN